jgi:hypothetical protein
LLADEIHRYRTTKVSKKEGKDSKKRARTPPPSSPEPSGEEGGEGSDEEEESEEEGEVDPKKKGKKKAAPKTKTTTKQKAVASSAAAAAAPKPPKVEPKAKKGKTSAPTKTKVTDLQLEQAFDRAGETIRVAPFEHDHGEPDPDSREGSDALLHPTPLTTTIEYPSLVEVTPPDEDESFTPMCGLHYRQELARVCGYPVRRASAHTQHSDKGKQCVVCQDIVWLAKTLTQRSILCLTHALDSLLSCVSFAHVTRATSTTPTTSRSPS